MKNSKLLQPPTVEPVTLEDLKAHLRISHDAEDALLQNLITAARQACEAFTGLALQTQSWRLQLDRAAPAIKLPKTPVQSVTAVTCDGFEVPPEDYNLDAAGTKLSFLTAPQPASRFAGINIDYIAGFGDNGADVPEMLRQGIRQLAAHLYEQRGDTAASALIPSGAADLFQPYRIMSMT